jgi:hypothetical protein
VTEEYNDYPVMMVHEHWRKATVTSYDNNGRVDYQGTPEFMPPVTVHDADQEAIHEAQGYKRHGKGDPAAYASAHQDFPAEDYVAEEYPKWVNGVLCNDANEEATAQASSNVVELEQPKSYVPHETTEVDALKAQLEALQAQIAAMAQPAKNKGGRPRKTPLVA